MRRQLLWEDAKATAARNRHAVHAVSPGNPLAPSPRRPELLIPHDGARQQGQSSGISRELVPKPPHSPASLAALPFC